MGKFLVFSEITGAHDHLPLQSEKPQVRYQPLNFKETVKGNDNERDQKGN